MAENSGGAHCLKYGFTVNHVTGAEVVLPDDDVVHLGGVAPGHPGYDLLGVSVGSEGALGVATQVTLRLVRTAEAVRTRPVGFRSVEGAAGAVSDIIAAGIAPAAIEMTHALAIEAAAAALPYLHAAAPEVCAVARAQRWDPAEGGPRGAPPPRRDRKTLGDHHALLRWTPDVDRR